MIFYRGIKKMKKKILSFAIVFMLIISTCAYAVNISIDNVNVGFTEQTGAPFVDGSSRTQVPLRITMESFGATVKWDDSTKTAIIEKDGIKVEVPIGQNYIKKNGQQIKNDTAAIIKDGKTYLPIRAVLESFGASVGWDNATQTVTASRSGNVVALENLKIHFIDVGQADSILIDLSGDNEILIDAGNKGDADTIINYVKNQNIDDIEYLILTHFHEDHIGAAPDIINKLKIEKVYMPDTTADTDIYKDTMQAIWDNNITSVKAKGGLNIINNQGLKFDVLAPNSMWYSEMNEYSLVTKLLYGDTSFLFTGDAESVSELEMTRAGYNLNADLLKVGHHGGDTSTSQIFLDAVTPKYAIISVGTDNTYGHPHQKALDRLIATGAKIYRTDEQGNIVATSNGTIITLDKVASTVITPPVQEPSVTTPAVPTVPTTNGTATESNAKYIGNSDSLKFHKPGCSSVSSMSQINKVFFLERIDATNKSYVPCGRCKP